LDRDWEPQYKSTKTSGKSAEYLVVVPVINEGNRLHNLLKKISLLSLRYEFDLLVSDGGSTDGSVGFSHLKMLGVDVLIEKIGPGGLGRQLQCAYAYALSNGYRGVVTIDGNDKDDPEAIPRMIQKLREGFDFIQGSRFISGGRHENTPLSRILGVRLIHAPLLNLSSGFRWTDTTQGFRAYSRQLLDSPHLQMFRESLGDYSLLFYVSHKAPSLGFRCLEIGTTRVYPKSGKIPTKIGGIRGGFKVFKSLVLVISGSLETNE
jgi:dolichol-phosphate mannosyltransferase